MWECGSLIASDGNACAITAQHVTSRHSTNLDVKDNVLSAYHVCQASSVRSRGRETSTNFDKECGSGLASSLERWKLSKTLNSRSFPFPASAQQGVQTMPYVIPRLTSAQSFVLPLQQQHQRRQQIAQTKTVPAQIARPVQHNHSTKSRLSPQARRRAMHTPHARVADPSFSPCRICRGGRTGCARLIAVALASLHACCIHVSARTSRRKGCRAKAHGTRAARVRQGTRSIPRKHQNGPPQ